MKNPNSTYGLLIDGCTLVYSGSAGAEWDLKFYHGETLVYRLNDSCNVGYAIGKIVGFV